MNGNSRPVSSSGSSDLARELKANQAEMEISKKREGAMRSLLNRAVHQGFIVDGEDTDVTLGKDSPVPDEEVIKKLMSAVVRMKQEKAVIQVSFPSLSELQKLIIRMSLSLKYELLQRKPQMLNDYVVVLSKKLLSTEPKSLLSNPPPPQMYPG